MRGGAGFRLMSPLAPPAHKVSDDMSRHTSLISTMGGSPKSTIRRTSSVLCLFRTPIVICLCLLMLLLRSSSGDAPDAPLIPTSAASPHLQGRPWPAFAMASAAGMSTGLGALLVCCVGALSERLFAMTMAFSAGVMMCAAPRCHAHAHRAERGSRRCRGAPSPPTPARSARASTSSADHTCTHGHAPARLAGTSPSSPSFASPLSTLRATTPSRPRMRLRPSPSSAARG